MTYQEFAKQWEDDSDHILCHTSGSTGKPSTIRLPKSRMLESARRTAEHFHLTEASHLHSCISPDYIGGKMMYVRSRLLGCGFSWEEPSNRILEDYTGPRIDLVSVVPSQMDAVLGNLELQKKVSRFLIGGSAIPPEIRKGIEDSGIEAYESYGMTETASHIAVRRVMATPTAFYPLPGISVRSQEGALTIDIKGWKEIVTNDAVKINDDGGFEILGRLDNAVVSGGKKIFPETLEARLSPYLRTEFYFTSRPDPKWGEALVMVVLNGGESEDEIRDICDRELARWEHPKAIIFTDDIERTGNGKIRRILPPN